MKRNTHFYSRKIHRYLGLILGVQFILWTAGGLYFSWSDMDQVHGDHHKKAAQLFYADLELISPSQVLNNIRHSKDMDSLISLQLIQISGKPVYQIVFTQQSVNSSHPHPRHIQLADAQTGALLPPLTKQEAVEQARLRYNGKANVEEVEYLTELNNHHEYRESPLPAYAITFDDASHTTVYVAAELGTVQKFRNNEWRLFDFLWMMHTMDYRTRDNFGNMLLRIFSMLGLVTIFSGFILYFFSSPTIRRFQRKTGFARLKPAISSENKP
jgi:uncharacterized iron-regulated membrane protein